MTINLVTPNHVTPNRVTPHRHAAEGVFTRVTRTVAQVQGRMAGWLARHSIATLRVSLGLIFLGFGVLKFFPGVSPAQELVERTLTTLSLGLLSDQTALLAAAVTECFIGITLITGKLLRLGLVVLFGACAGFFAPLVLFFADMFPDGAPTLDAQYILKDIVLVAAGMVVAARSLGARLATSARTPR